MNDRRSREFPGGRIVSLLLLIDGYNVIAPVAPPTRGAASPWLQRERAQLIHRLTRHLDRSLCARTCVVFDAANPPADRPSQFEVEGLDVRFAVEYAEADDLLEELIAQHSAPKRLAVVSSDQRVKTAASRRGCAVFESQDWLDDLLEGKVGLAALRGDGAAQGTEAERGEKPKPSVGGDDVAQWLREFGF
jgi:predicted RNA-binding protein with PIN domain